jgi:hypothetical protein
MCFALPLVLTSCEGSLDDIFGTWDRPTPTGETAEEKPDMLPVPLTLEAIEDRTINVKFDAGLDLANPITYTKNGVEYSGGTTDYAITVSAGDKVSFHSTNAALGKVVDYSYKHPTIKPTNRCYIYGNMMSLINDEGNFAIDKVITGDYALYRLFFLGGPTSWRIILPKNCYYPPPL